MSKVSLRFKFYDMRKLTLLVLFLTTAVTFSQEKEIENLKYLIDRGSPDSKAEVYYNTNDSEIDINGYQFELYFVEYNVLSDGTLRVEPVNSNHTIFDGNNDKNISMLEIKFFNKADAYKAIDLMKSMR